MSYILGPNGQPIDLGTTAKRAPDAIMDKRAEGPKTGNAFGAWAGRDTEYATMPGGSTIGFNLNNLTLSDFRQMRDHYQINSSLAVLSFMQHQSDWSIECDDKKIADFCHEQIAQNWTGLNRGLAQANWAGFSPMALEWENVGRRTHLTKIRDLVPEECAVNWKEEEGWAPPGRVAPKFKTFDGIKQFGTPWPIPVENSLYYPILMENGDYRGRNLLRPAFQSWYFSLLMHVFANRYYERFGEPVPVGRAPYDDDITMPDGTSVTGAKFMSGMLQNLRNRSVVVLPNDRSQGQDGQVAWDYSLEYMESQMRGADFERYMTRLDEEMSLGLFTPILLLRTADVGSYNLGQGHMQVYLWMLNAMNDDRKVYIDKYLLSKMVDYNFGVNAPRAKIVFRKLGNTDSTLLKEVLTALIQNGKASVDVDELGSLVGLSLTEIKETIEEPKPEADPNEEESDEDGADAGSGDAGDDGASNGRPRERVALSSTDNAPVPGDVVKDIVERVKPQVANAFARAEGAKGATISMGFKRKMSQAVGQAEADRLYAFMDQWCVDLLELASTPEDFMARFASMLVALVEE